MSEKERGRNLGSEALLSHWINPFWWNNKFLGVYSVGVVFFFLLVAIERINSILRSSRPYPGLASLTTHASAQHKWDFPAV